MFEIIDGHGHIFPDLAGACGFADAETHLLYMQRSMHTHGNQPYRRKRDHAATPVRPLWSTDDHSEAGRRKDVRFRVSRHGRFEWEHEGEGYYLQFLPPSMRDMECSAEFMVVQMDYAGVKSVVLQNDHIYGNNARYFAEAMRRHPGRFIGLAQVDEAFAWRDDQMKILEEQIALGMRGLYFTMTGYFRNAYARLYDDPVYDAFWRRVAQAQWPVFWVHSTKSPIGDYGAEMRVFRRYMDRHPGVKNVLVHGVPTSVFADDQDVVRFPDWMTEIMTRYPVWSEVLFPIMWGGRMPYPYVRAHGHIRQMTDAFGPDRLIWGSDMPNVERFCTYRQTFTYCWEHCDFWSEADRRKIFRENALGLFTGGEAAATL